MAEVAIGLAVVGAAGQAAGTMMQSREQARAAAFERDNYDRQRQELLIAADQQEAKRRNELTASIETISALRSGRGVGMSSPTGSAILSSAIQDESDDIRTERLGYLTRAEQARLGSKMAGRKARMSILAGNIGAVTGIAETGAKIATMRR